MLAKMKLTRPKRQGSSFYLTPVESREKRQKYLIKQLNKKRLITGRGTLQNAKGEL
jgi:hypothetical protein